MILLDQRWSLDVVSRFPHVVALGVSYPFYKILQLFSLPMMSVIMNGLDLILFIIIDEVRWWSGVVFAVLICFSIQGQQGCMEHRMDGLLEREF